MTAGPSPRLRYFWLLSNFQGALVTQLVMAAESAHSYTGRVWIIKWCTVRRLKFLLSPCVMSLGWTVVSWSSPNCRKPDRQLQQWVCAAGHAPNSWSIPLKWMWHCDTRHLKLKYTMCHIPLCTRASFKFVFWQASYITFVHMMSTATDDEAMLVSPAKVLSC